MGRILESALATFMITIIDTIFASWVATTIGNRITELFTILIKALRV